MMEYSENRQKNAHKGKWIPRRDIFDGDDGYICSLCGEHVSFQYRVCPTCKQVMEDEGTECGDTIEVYEKIVRLEDVKRTLENAYYGEATLGELLETLDNISPVEQTMSAVEFMKAIEWLDYYDHDTYQLYLAKKMRHDYAGAVAIVENWVKEHPKYERS